MHYEKNYVVTHWDGGSNTGGRGRLAWGVMKSLIEDTIPSPLLSISTHLWFQTPLPHPALG